MLIKSPYSLMPMVFGVAALVAMPFQSAQALSATEVSAIAEAVTVRIEGQNPGSGVIIKRQGNVYTVLTAAHVVATEDQYDVVTADDQQHPLNYKQVKKIQNIDLALVEFTSSKTYKIAELGDSAGVKSGEPIYVSGFPMPTAAITKSIWTFSKGEVTANAKSPLADGYALVYSNDTLPGMSGGAVLDSQGQLVGIHGRADAEQQEQRSETVFVKTGFNLGIPIDTFLSLVAKVEPDLGFVSKVTEPKGSTLTADDWFLQAGNKSKKGDYQGAIAGYDKAIALNPEYAKAYYNRGVIYTELKEYPKAIADYDKAITLDPEFALAHYNRGNIHNILMKYPQAIVDFDKAITLDPENVGAYNNRGNTYVKLKQYPQAIADFDKAIALDSEHVEAYNNRAATYNILGKYPQSLADSNKAIILDPEHGLAYYNRGLAYAETGNIPQAKQDLQTAAQLLKQHNNQAAYENTIQLLQKL